MCARLHASVCVVSRLCSKCACARASSAHVHSMCVRSDVTEITYETNSPFSRIEEAIALTKRKRIKANKPQMLSQYSYTDFYPL